MALEFWGQPGACLSRKIARTGPPRLDVLGNAKARAPSPLQAGRICRSDTPMTNDRYRYAAYIRDAASAQPYGIEARAIDPDTVAKLLERRLEQNEGDDQIVLLQYALAEISR